LLDTGGFVAEGSGENIFIVMDGQIKTPATGCILNGITRQTAITLMTDRGLTIHETQLTRNDLYCADEVFFTGTAAEVTPIIEIDHRTIGNGKPGPIATQLLGDYLNAVQNKETHHPKWLTKV